MTEIKLTHTLYDCESGESKMFTITLTKYGILITPDGYGDMCSPDGKGQPILVEFYEKIPRVVVWGDINQECATDFITLEGARETERKGEEQ